MTHTPSCPSSSTTDGNASSPRKRSIRCLRCSGRKFHTSKDLALHILSKHSRAHISLQNAVKDNLQDDARSITVSSPHINSADVDELDRLLATHDNKDASSRHSNGNTKTKSNRQRSASSKNKTITKRKPLSTSPRRQNIQYVQVDSSANTSTETESDSHSYHPNKENTKYNRKTRQRKLKSITPVEGESIGPTAADVMVRTCREKRVPLVPEVRPAQVLNFANALF